jgi:cob(I)alamin adenosyltransferase
MPSRIFKPLETGDQEQHRLRMQAVQAEMRTRIAAASGEKGITAVFTGDGKGKSTAAFGMLARMLGHGRRCVVVQFIKSGDTAMERRLRGPGLSWHRVGRGFTWDTQDKAADIEAVRTGWEIALGAMRDAEVHFLLLDELNIALLCEYLTVEEVVLALEGRVPGQHVALTGRGAPPELLEAADLVTEMREVKHPFKAGIRAQAGIEY